MNIAVDSTTLAISNSGITSYLKGLQEGFAQLKATPSLTLYTPNTNIKNRKLRTIHRELYWQQYWLPKMAAKDGNQLLFSPSHNVALRSSIPRVVTFHDFYLLRNPQSFTAWHRWYGTKFYPKIINSGCNIIVISKFTESELYHFFPKAFANIRVIPNAISDEWRRIHDEVSIQNVIKKHCLPNEFILAVGSVEPRKNLSVLFRIIKNDPKLPPLVLISPGGWNNASELAEIRKLQEIKRLYWLNNIDRDELIHIYNKALVFVYPSLYEGMGAPPLEAMACGCPVITSNNSALAEYYSGIAHLIDPLNEEEIGFAIQSVLVSSQKREEMIAKGLKHKEHFSFYKVAERTLNYFQELI